MDDIIEIERGVRSEEILDFFVELKSADIEPSERGKKTLKIYRMSDHQQLLLQGCMDGPFKAFQLLLAEEDEYSVEIRVSLANAVGDANLSIFPTDIVKTWQKLTVGNSFSLMLLKDPQSMPATVSLYLLVCRRRYDACCHPPELKQNVNIRHADLFSYLFTSEDLYDCQIVTMEGHKIDCHLTFLCLESDVIRKMFVKRKFLESPDRQFHVDFPAEIVRLILPYFYTGRLPNISRETVIDAYKLADKYQIPRLKAYLAEEIPRRAKEFVDPLTIEDFEDFADDYNMAKLSSFCREYQKKTREYT